MSTNQFVAPFVKWVGGKRQLYADIKPLLPSHISTYYEPFVGGGAVLFAEQPKKAVINDFNSELINVYKTIRDSPDELIQSLEQHVNEKEYFYEVRAWDRQDDYQDRSDVERASRILFLNKTCYNGLYRVNKAGEFNTPFGRYKNPNIVNEQTIRAVSHYLNANDINILNTDFEDSLKYIRKGAFVYFDPPYDPLTKSANFTGYVEGGFGDEDQQRLRDKCIELNSRGVKFLLSNSNTPMINELYNHPDFIIKKVYAKRSVNSKANKRGEVSEVLIRNYD